MKRTSLALLFLLLVGCATEPKVLRHWRFESINLDVSEVNQAHITSRYRDARHATMDDGTIITFENVRSIKGYKETATGEIFFVEGYFCIVGHELCHREGLPREVCMKNFDFCGFR